MALLDMLFGGGQGGRQAPAMPSMGTGGLGLLDTDTPMGGGFGSGLKGLLDGKGPLLMALGAGIAAGDTWGEGIGKGLGLASQVQQKDIALKTKMAPARIAYQAALARGMSPQDALLAAYNPELAKGMGVISSPTDDMREYEAAKAQGFEGSLLDYQTQVRRASSTNINLPPQEKAFDAAAGKGMFDYATGVFDKQNEATERLRGYEQIGHLLSNPNVYTGTGGPAIQGLKKAGATLFGLNFEGVADAEVAGKIAATMIGDFKSMLGPQISNSDKQLLASIPPNLGDTPQGVQLMLGIAREAKNAADERAAKISEIMQRDGGRLTMQGRLEFEAWSRQRPVFSPETFRQIQSAAQSRTVPRGPTAGSDGALKKLYETYQGLER